MKIHGIPRIFRITTHRWEFHRSASTAPLPLSPIPAPSPARGAYLGAREPSQRALSNRISSQPKVIRHPRRAEGDDEDEALGRDGGREKRAKKENKERERRNKRQKDREGRKREERGTGWKSTEDPAQLFCTRRMPPSSFSTLPSARNSIFVSARVYTRFSLPRRQWKATLHRAPPVYIVYPPISADENELSSFERAEFVHRPSSDRLLLRARMATKTRLRATHRE